MARMAIRENDQRGRSMAPQAGHRGGASVGGSRLRAAIGM
jgi:hypothetical protein